jgi:phenylacetate-CoA ligase
VNLSWLFPSIGSDFRRASDYGRRVADWPEEQIPSMQLERIARLWTDAVTDVPYFSQLVADGRAPATIRTWEDYDSIPILDKGLVRSNADAFIRRSGPPDRFAQTAGSTGTPLRFGTWSTEGQPLRAAKLAAWIREGYRQSDRVLLIWGHSHLLGTGWRGQVNHLKRSVKDLIAGYHRVDAYTLGPLECGRIADFIVSNRPAGVIGYAAALDLLGRTVASRRSALRASGVKFVLSTAELPPKPDSHEMLRDLFNAPVIEELGGVDSGHLAMRRQGSAWEVFPDLNLLEAGADRDPDGASPLLVTSLYRRYTPWFRYQQGDLVDGCRTLKNGHVHRFDRLLGRVNDSVRMGDGRSVHSVALFHCIHQEPQILNIQLSLREGGPALRLVSLGAVDAPVEARIRQRLAQVHPELERMSIEYVEDLEVNRAGKRRWIADERSDRP